MSHQPPVSCIPNTGKMSKAKKVVEEAKEIGNPEIDLVDKGISSLDEIPSLCMYPHNLLVLFIYGTCVTCLKETCFSAYRMFSFFMFVIIQPATKISEFELLFF